MKITGLYQHGARFAPKDVAPGRRAGEQLRCGVGEVVDVFAGPFAEQGQWRIVSGGGTLEQGQRGAATYTCPDVAVGATTANCVLEFDGGKVRIEFEVVAPSTGDLVKESDIHKKSPTNPALNKPNSGFFGRMIVGPADVSFKGILVREGDGLNVASGVFQDFNNNNHPEGASWGEAVDLTAQGTVFGWDEVFTPANGAYPWDPAGADGLVGYSETPIKWRYKLPSDPSADGRVFALVHHRAWAYSSGRVCVQKGTAFAWTNLADPRSYSHPLNAGLNGRGLWLEIP